MDIQSRLGRDREMGKVKVFIILMAILTVVLCTVAITSAHRAIEESNRTIERIDRKIGIYENNH